MHVFNVQTNLFNILCKHATVPVVDNLLYSSSAKSVYRCTRRDKF